MTKNLSEETGLQPILKDYKNPLIGYLNINILRGKISSFRIIMKTLSLDYLVLREIKLDETFPTKFPNLMLKGMKSELGVVEINTVKL